MTDSSHDRSVFRYILRLLGFIAAGILVDLTFALFAVQPHPIAVASIDHEKLLKRKLLFREQLDVVFVGSSMTQSSVNPAVVAGADSPKIWNAGIPGKSNVWWQSDLIEELAQKNKPSHIIYPIEVFSFGQDPIEEEHPFLIPFLHSYKNRKSVKGWVAESFAAKELQELPITKSVPLPLPVSRTLNAADVVPVFVRETGWVDTLDLEANPAWIHTPSAEFSASDEERLRLVRLLQNMRERRVRISFLILPNFLNYGDAPVRKKQEAAHDRLSAFLQNLTGEQGYGEVLDARYWLPGIVEDSQFWYDSVHLNGSGSALFSPVLFKKLGYL